MEPPQAHHLRQEFSAAFARSDDPQVLQSLHAMLRQSKQTLRDPLRTPGKNAEQRKALEEAKAKPADPVHLPGRAPERILEPQRKLLIDAVLLPRIPSPGSDAHLCKRCTHLQPSLLR